MLQKGQNRAGHCGGSVALAKIGGPPVKITIDGAHGLLIYYAPFVTVGYSSGQRGQTVNLLANAFSGSNPLPTTIKKLDFGRVFLFVILPWQAVSFPLLYGIMVSL